MLTEMAEATEWTKAATSTIAVTTETAGTAIAEAAQTAETAVTAIADVMMDSCHRDGFRKVGSVVAGAGHGDQTEQKKHSSDLHVGSEKKKSSMGVCLLLNS